MPRRKYRWRVPKATREKILQTAQREKLSGAQVAKRFGISAHTYYSWRSPARGIHVKSKAEAVARANGHSPIEEADMARKKNKRGQRYTAAQKRRILEAARREGLTGEQVQKRFGVSTLTFYRWRGPARGRKAKAGRSRANGRAAGLDDIRASVRARVQAILPGVIREQVDAYVTEILGKRRRGRPSTRV